MKENVQMISWGVEFATFVVAVLIVGLVWRMSSNASKNRKSKDKIVP